MSWLNWSNLAHAVGDMRDEEEYADVVVLLPDGRTVTIQAMERHGARWVLVATTKLPEGFVGRPIVNDRCLNCGRPFNYHGIQGDHCEPEFQDAHGEIKRFKPNLVEGATTPVK